MAAGNGGSAAADGGAERAVSLRGWMAAGLFFLLGLGLAAGPWIVVLSGHYHEATFSTAGSANHADVNPENFGRDPLWNHGLDTDFISDPHLAGDWSAFQDAGHFMHQARVFLHNVLNCLGHVAAWMVLWGMATLFLVIRRLRGPPGGSMGAGWWWCVMAAALYCGGYCMINVEARYIAPVVSPLLCLGSLLVIRGAVGGRGASYVGGIEGAAGFLACRIVASRYCFQFKTFTDLNMRRAYHTQSVKYTQFFPGLQR